MGSVQDCVKCPKCGEYSYVRDYYYKSGEEYCFCSNCGYVHNVELKRDENKNSIRTLEAKYDLSKGNVLYARAKRDKNEELEIIDSLPVSVDDTDENIYDFLNLYQSFYKTFAKELPEKFKSFSDKKDTPWFANIFLYENGEYKQLWYHVYDLKIVNGFLEVWVPKWEAEESGGFGVVTVKTEYGSTSYSLEEGVVPEITDDVIFASAIIDGKLTILKQPEFDPEDFGPEIYSWDDLYERAEGAACGDPELRAKDNARAILEEIIKEKTGNDINTYEIPEEEIEDFLKKSEEEYWFDEDGNLIK